MQKHSYEIEIKSLLGGKEKADALVEKMKAKDPGLKTLGSHKQLNHYFTSGDLQSLYENVKTIVDAEKLAKLKDLAGKAKDFSVRTRWADGRVILVLKASVDDTTSQNGTARLEWEAPVAVTIEELDNLVLKSGFSYQAKWSRERSEYVYNGANVSIDKNAGYGYLAEFEKVIDDESRASEVKEEIRQMMAELDAAELAQDRLARMFDYYNNNWQNYYGTDKIFNIE
ncbi:MAG: hypothetical protein M1333_01905 [Patescibacteria group bacterium]|nr:hypothetical protein [Patescibacteria group bacterium]